MQSSVFFCCIRKILVTTLSDRTIMFPPPAGIARPLNIRVNGWTGQTARATSTVLEQSDEFSGAESARLGATASPPPTFSPLTTTGSEELSDSYADLGASCDQDDLASLVSSLSGMASFADFFIIIRRLFTILYRIIL